MTPDSLDQWSQMLSGQLDDWHPPFHTMVNWLITRVWLSPASIAMTQILALSLVVGYGLHLFRRNGMPGWAAWIVCLLFALSPINGVMVVTILKDVCQSIAILFMSILIYQVVVSHGDWLIQSRSWVLLGITTALVALFRHNGPAMAFGALVLLLIAYSHCWRKLLLALSLAVALWLVMIGPVYTFSHVVRMKPGLQFMVHHVAAHLNAGTPMNAEQTAFLNELCPTRDRWRYNCLSVMTTIGHRFQRDRRFNWDFLAANQIRFAKLLVELTVRNPKVALDHFKCQSAFVWNVKAPPPQQGTITLEESGKITTMMNNKFGLSLNSKLSSALLHIVGTLVQFAEPFERLMRSPALYLYFALGVAALISVRLREWRYLLIVTPLVINSAVLALTAPMPAFRFLWSNCLVASFCVGFLLKTPHREVS
jgi:hypothetical protein